MQTQPISHTDLSSSPFRLGEPVPPTPEHLRYYCRKCDAGGRDAGGCEVHPGVELEDSWREGWEPHPEPTNWREQTICWTAYGISAALGVWWFLANF